MVYKYYVYKIEYYAKNLVDQLTAAFGDKVPYTEVRESNNGQGYAVRADDFTATVTSKTPQDLPADFYKKEI